MKLPHETYGNLGQNYHELDEFMNRMGVTYCSVLRGEPKRVPDGITQLEESYERERPDPNPLKKKDL